MDQIIINQNTTADVYNIPAFTTLIIAQRCELSVRHLVCNRFVTIRLDGGILSIGNGSASNNFSLTGFGTMRVTSKLELSDFASIAAENISIELSSGEIEFGANNRLSLANYPVVGGLLHSLPEANNKINAPARNIFLGTSLTGGWNCDVAYPEWFVENDTTNWAEPINKAFTIAGEVHLQSRTYTVRETIDIPPVGKLTGTRSGNQLNDAGGVESGANSNDKVYGTIITPLINGSNDSLSFAGNYIIILNIVKSSLVSKPEPRKEFPPIGAKIANLKIENREASGSNHRLNGICIAYNAELENISFYNLGNAIKWTDHYADLKKITHCNLNEMLPSSDEETYIIDFGFLGDALIFQGNAIHSGFANNHGIKVHTCTSGIINSNIINADVYIRCAKGLTFSNNHMENGAQIIIDQSSVTLSDNFIQKGVRPSVVIKSSIWGDNSVVSLHNNQYIYYSYAFELIDPQPSSVNVEQPTTASTTDIARICDYDIGIAGEKYVSGDNVVEYGKCQCILNICNELKLWVTDGLIGKSLTYGISIGLSNDGGENYSGLDSFNLQSHILSLSSSLRIMNDCMYSFPPVTVQDWESPHIFFAGLNNHTQWLLDETGTYVYYYQTIWSFEKKWVAGLPLQPFATVSLPDKTRGVVLGLAGADKSGNCVMTRIIRCKMNGTNTIENVKYADVPIINALWMYDNGISIGCYKWLNARSLSNAIYAGTPPTSKSFTLIGETVLSQ